MKAKHRCRIRNWKEYNKSLIHRGSITVWFSDDAIENWHAKRTRKRDRPTIYSDEAILTALMIKSVFHLPLRALQGFLICLVVRMKFPLSVPCYTQICKRSSALGQKLKRLSRRNVTDLVSRSSG